MSISTVSSRLIASRADLVGDRWSLNGTDEYPALSVVVGTDAIPFDVRHDTQAAPPADVRFVGWARDDFDWVVSCLGGEVSALGSRLGEIRARLASTTPGHWECYLESAGGLGGGNVITMSGSDADLYLFLDGRAAPDAEWQFVALLHEELPAILEAAEANASD